MTSTDTIVALASGRGVAGVAVLRASGPEVVRLLEATTGSVPPPRKASLRKLRDPESGEVLDQALVLFFPGPSSFTGEDVAEFHVHGGTAVISGVTSMLCRFEGVRLAEPGEFSRRAFSNGRMDLTAAEGLADLVDAETEAQRRQALRQMEGALGAVYEGWRAELIELMALLEAEIDFPDEDLPGGLSTLVGPRVDALASAMMDHLKDAALSQRVRDGVRVAIIGAPNVGKSSLINVLARREAAIVSPIAGTTRDVVEVRLVLSGVPVWIADTAGLRETEDVVELEGVRRARGWAAQADIILRVTDGVMEPPDDLGGGSSTIIVRNKVDLEAGVPAGRSASDEIWLSAKTGEGVETLEAWLTAEVARLTARSEQPGISRLRHKVGVEAALTALHRVRSAYDLGAEVVAEDLRIAARALGEIVGRVDVEDVLDRVFAQFCIGK